MFYFIKIIKNFYKNNKKKLFKGGNSNKWNKKLEHNGPCFPEPYEKHDVPLIYNGEKIKLNEQAEEYASIYAKYLSSKIFEGDDKKRILLFNKNFWNDWKKLLNNEKIKDFEKCDF